MTEEASPLTPLAPAGRKDGSLDRIRSRQLAGAREPVVLLQEAHPEEMGTQALCSPELFDVNLNDADDPGKLNLDLLDPLNNSGLTDAAAPRMDMSRLESTVRKDTDRAEPVDYLDQTTLCTQ